MKGNMNTGDQDTLRFDVCECWLRARKLCKKMRGNWRNDRHEYFSRAAAQMEQERLNKAGK